MCLSEHISGLIVTDVENIFFITSMLENIGFLNFVAL